MNNKLFDELVTATRDGHISKQKADILVSSDFKMFGMVEFTKSEHIENSPDFIMTVSGYASTIDVDRMNDIVEPSAFESSIATFMRFPVLHLNHDMRDGRAPIGKVMQYLIDETGLLVEAQIVNTAAGREVKALIEAGILKAFSIGFNIKRMEFGNKESPNRITDVELIEISIVSSPANTEAVIEQATSKGITIKSLVQKNTFGEGVNLMLTEKQMEQVETKVDEKIEISVGEIRKEHEVFSTGLSELKQALDNANGDRAESNRLVDKMTRDFVDSQGRLDTAIEDAKKNKRGVKVLPILSTKDILERTDDELDAALGSDGSAKAKEFKKVNDDIILLDALLFCSAKNHGGAYGRGEFLDNRDVRIKTLKMYPMVNEFAKSLEAGTAAEGQEWVPTDLSTQLEELYRLNRSVAALFEEFNMPTNPFDWPLATTDPIAQLITEQSSVIENYADANEQTPATGKTTFTAFKARGRIQLSAELTEDAAFAVLPWATKRAGISLVDAVEQAIIDGDDNGTHRDGDVTAGTDFRQAWDGLRFHANAKGAEEDGANGALTPAMMRQTRVRMLKYGVRPAELAWIISIRTYLFSIMANSNFSDLQTIDKYGPLAQVLTGEQLKFDAVPIIVSEYQRDDLNDSGVQDGVVEDKAASILVNRAQWMIGNKRGITVSVEKNVPFDVFTVFAFKRVAFQTFRTATSENNVASLIDYLTI